MANITVTTNQSVIDVTETGGVNVTNTTDVITVLPSGTLNITTTNTDRLVAGSNQVILNTNATMTFPNNAIDFGSQTADLKSSAWSELWWHNANPSPTAGQGTNTYIWSWENQAGIAVESVGNSGKEWYFNSDGTTQFPGYKFPYADGSANQILKTDGSGVLSWYSPSDINTTYTIASASTTGGANLNLVGSDSTTDSVAYKGAGATTVTSTDANTVTITSTDTNTTYTYTAGSTTGGANLTLTGSDATTNTVKLTNAGHITATYTSATEVTLGSDATDANTVSTIVARDASGNFSAGGATLGNVTVGVATDQTITTTSGDLILNSTTGLIQLNNTALQSTVAQTWTVLDNNASALSIDATGKTGILKVISTDGAEGVTMSGTLGVTGAATTGTLSRVLGQQINTRNSTYTPPTIPLTAVTGLNGLAVASSTGGYFPDISVNNYLADTGAGNNGAGVSLRSTSGTSASPTGTANNQIVGTVNFDGWATGTNANWASYSATITGGTGGGVSYVYPLQAQAYARQAFTNGTVSTAVTGASGNGTTATLTFALLNVQTYFAGGVITVAGMTPSGYNGTYTITAATTTSVSYANATTGFTSGGTISIPVVSAAGTGYRIRGFQTSTPLIGANRINFADFNASSTTFKSAAYTFINEVIPGATQTATNYMTLGSTFGSINQDTFNVRNTAGTSTYLALGATTGNINQDTFTVNATAGTNPRLMSNSTSTTVYGDLNVQGTGSTNILSTFNNAVFTQTPYAGVSYSFPLRISGKRTDNVNLQDGDNTSIQYQLFGSGSNFVNLGTQTMTYRTSGDNSIDFKLENNAGPSVTTTPMTISAVKTTIRAGTNASVSDVMEVSDANILNNRAHRNSITTGTVTEGQTYTPAANANNSISLTVNTGSGTTVVDLINLTGQGTGGMYTIMIHNNAASGTPIQIKNTRINTNNLTTHTIPTGDRIMVTAYIVGDYATAEHLNVA